MVRHLSVPPPASFAQQRLWFIDQLEGGSTQYNQPLALRLRGRVDPGALHHAFNGMVTRHDVLRTVFRLEEGTLRQIVLPSATLDLPVQDLCALPPAEQDRRLAELVAAETYTVFDLGRDLPLRVRLLRLGAEGAEESWVLLATMHHIASDAWSIGLYLKEFAQLHDAIAQGRPARLEPLAIQYADHAREQRDRVADGRMARAMEYWREHLAGIPAVHSMPLDRPRPRRQEFAGHTHRIRIDGPLLGALRGFAARHDATLFMVLQGALAGLLHWRSGEDDIVIGVPFAGRMEPGTAALLRLFVNTLVFRNKPRPEDSFEQFLATVRTMAIDAFEHQDLPFDLLVDLLKPERSQNYAPVAQVLFSMHPENLSGLTLHGLRADLIESRFSRVKCDLEIEATETADAVEMEWRTAASLFEPATGGRMANGYLHLLRSVLADPSCPLRDIDILPDAERAEIAAWNRTDADFPMDQTLIGRFEAQAAATPDATAIIQNGRAWTYMEIDAHANRLVRLLIDRHAVKANILVGHCLDRSVEMVVAILAIMKAGGAYVALDPGLPQERLAYMAADSATPVVLTQPHLAARLEGCGAAILAVTLETAADQDASPLPARAGSGDMAYVIYTSGSTGRPKGTLNLHASPCNRIEAMQRQFGLTAQDRVLQKTPLSFDVSVWGIFWPLSTGAAIVLAAPEGHKAPRHIEQVIAAHGVTLVHFVPSMLQIFLRAADAAQLQSLSQLMVSGEALTRELQRRCIEAFPGVRLVNH